MDSVKEWAKLKGYDYKFIDDELFELAPDWYREKAEGDLLLITDLARLIMAKKLLQSGYERTIWIDADVVIFNPQEFNIKVNRQYAFCVEFWINKPEQNYLGSKMNINNAMTIFTKNNSFLDFYIHACMEIVRKKNGLKKTSVGTKFLTTMYTEFPFALIEHMGLLSPLMLKEFYLNEIDIKKVLHKVYKTPVYALNLCGSFRNVEKFDLVLTDQVYEGVIDRLFKLYK